MVYVIQVWRQLSSRTRMELQYHPGPARKLSSNPYDIYHCWVLLLFFWLYNPSWLYFHSPVEGFSHFIFEVSRSHTTTRHSREDFSGRVISPSQRPLPDNIQHSQQKNIHSPGGIRTHNLSRPAAEDPRLRPRGHCDRHRCRVYSEYTPDDGQTNCPKHVEFHARINLWN